MKVGIIAPSPVPFTRGGAERAWAGLAAALDTRADVDAEVVKLPVREHSLPDLVEAYRSFAALDVTHFDLVVTSKYPAWMVQHPRHVVWMFHPLRGLYDTYHVFGLPLHADSAVSEIRALVAATHRPAVRDELPGLFAAWDTALAAAGPDHPDLGLPSPVARSVVRWLDAVALSPAGVHRHLALSGTVAGREGYFPATVTPRVVHAPSDLVPPPDPELPRTHLFTASRLDGPKRIDMVVDAMAHVTHDVPLLVGGTGPLSGDLAERARGDERIRFLGFVGDDELPRLYATALAVPFVPADEDYGLIAVEAMACGAPVVTCTDSGGPTELVTDGVTGAVVAPDPRALGLVLNALVGDRARAARLGDAGRRRAAEITWDGVVAAVLGEPAPRPGPETATSARGGGAPPRAARVTPRTALARTRRHGRPRVVALTTFGVSEPRHGGQIRAARLYGAMARHVDVDVLALVDHGAPEGTHELGPGIREVAVARSAAHAAVGASLSAEVGVPVTDLVAGTHVHSTPAYLRALTDLARDAQLVLLAEPYLLPAAEAAVPSVPRLYDAYNVESELKSGALPGSAAGRRALAQVRQVEERAVTGSAAVTTCSAEDALALSLTHGRGLGDFTVIPNGTDCAVAVPTPEQRDRDGRRWLERFARLHPQASRAEALAVFFASWHPPNLDAAEILLWLAPQLPEVQFVLGGTHGLAFQDREAPDNLVFTGVVSDRAKHTLLTAAHVALNPMLQGSGTNLKVIEYLAIGVPVVSTPFGARGLDVVDGTHLLLAEPHHMVEAVRRVLADPDAAAERARAGRELAVRSYDWQALGDRMAEVVRRVLHK